MKKLLVLACLCLAGVAQAVDRPEVARYVKAYSGGEGSKVFVTRIGPADKAEVLIQITGIDTPQDGLILKGRVEPRDEGKSRRYYVTRKNQEVEILRLEQGRGTLYLPSLPDTPNEQHVSYDESLSRSCNPERMLSEYLEQEASK